MAVIARIKSLIKESNEFQSALVRMGVWTFSATYVGLSSMSEYYQVNMTSYIILFSTYLVLFSGTLISVVRRPEWGARRYFSLIMDITAATCALYLTGDATSPFYIIYLWIFISYGTRYGKYHLFTASVTSVITYLLMIIVLNGWEHDAFEVSFILFSLVMLPFYQLMLIRKLYESQQRAEASNQAKSSFLANMSHEIRTPLNGLMTMGELLLRSKLDDSQREYANNLVHSGRSLNTIINEILDYSRIEAGEVSINPAPFAIRTMVKEIHNLLQYGIQNKGLHFICEVDEEIPEVLFGDSARIRQVIINLIGNATRFTNDGGITLKIELINRAGDDYLLKFSVIDTGEGIPEHKMDKLFKRFSQVDDSLSRLHSGSGLGLVISKGLVEAMDGEIGVDSKPQHGSRFWFTLSMPAGVLQSVRQTVDKTPSPNVSGLNILLIDDDAINRLAGKRLMESEGHHVELATNGFDALEILRVKAFDLLLMDVHMPEMDGIEATMQIRNTFSGHKASVPIIGLTASVMEEERKRYLASGMDCVVAKPIDIDELNQKIQQLCKARIETVVT
jgi:two-component system sensor histidine kinase RpfC